MTFTVPFHGCSKVLEQSLARLHYDQGDRRFALRTSSSNLLQDKEKKSGCLSFPAMRAECVLGMPIAQTRVESDTSILLEQPEAWYDG
jgi:hypothetical protein